MAFLLSLQTGFTTCFSKTLQVTPIQSFSHPHLNRPGGSKGLVTEFELQCKSFGRKRPWTCDAAFTSIQELRHKTALELWFCIRRKVCMQAAVDLGVVTFEQALWRCVSFRSRSDGQRGLGFQTVDTEQCLRALFTCVSILWATGISQFPQILKK